MVENTADALKYIRLLWQHKLLGVCSNELAALLRGLYDVVPEKYLCIFTAKEIELVLVKVNNAEMRNTFHCYWFVTHFLLLLVLA